MSSQPGAQAYLPARSDLGALEQAADGCEGCGLYRRATQTVFGIGPKDAEMVLVGEQPGDSEDREGKTFVGPAGGLLDRALDEVGIERQSVYLTNAVKHFKFVPPERGKRRIHQKPARSEIVACRPWLIAQLNVIQPEVVVCLGATAAQSLMGTSFRISRQRGHPVSLVGEEFTSAATMVATAHPSSVLRARDEDRKQAYAALLDDLRMAAQTVRG